MYWRPTIILTFLYLVAGIAAGAQDSIPVRLIWEQTSPVVQLRDELYASPSMRVYQRENTYSALSAAFRKYNQDLYLQQEGSGRQTFTVHSETYLKPKEELTLWGKAYYNNERLYKVRFNETADYHLVYPYVMADSVGGDLKAETYAFSGGIAKAAGEYQLGLGAGFKGRQSYRDRDPRAQNVTSEIDLALSASRKLGSRYALALDLDGTKYGQRNSLSFVNEISTPLVYHAAGLGAYNEFLAGTRTSANFNGWGYGAHLQLSPVQYKGWFAHAGFRQWNVGKLLENITFDVGKVRELTLNGSIGYLYQQNRQHFIAELKATRVKRKGFEAKFNNRDAQAGIQLISEDLHYQHDYNALGVRSVYGRTGRAIDWFVGIEGTVHDHVEQYVQPDRELSYNNVVAGLDFTARKQVRSTFISLNLLAQRQENLQSRGSWPDVDPRKGIYPMLNSNFAYLTASGMNYGGGVRVDFPLTARLSCYISADAGYQSGTGKRDFRILTAFQF